MKRASSARQADRQIIHQVKIPSSRDYLERQNIVKEYYNNGIYKENDYNIRNNYEIKPIMPNKIEGSIKNIPEKPQKVNLIIPKKSDDWQMNPIKIVDPKKRVLLYNLDNKEHVKPIISSNNRYNNLQIGNNRAMIRVPISNYNNIFSRK